jgi:hypothetical protein
MPSKKRREQAIKSGLCTNCISVDPERKLQPGQKKCGICLLRAQNYTKKNRLKYHQFYLLQNRQRKIDRSINNQCLKCGIELSIEEDENKKTCSRCRVRMIVPYDTGIKDFNQYNQLLEDTINETINRHDA